MKKTVTVYSKPNCMPCNFTKGKLNDMEIEFLEKDITVDEKNLEEVQKLGFGTVPVIKIDTEGDQVVFGGFQPDKLEEFLGA